MVLTSYFDPSTLENPYPFFAWLRAEAPVWRVPETGHWLVSRYAEVKRVCLEPEVFSSRLAAVVTRDDAGTVQLLDTGVADTPQGSVLGVADGAAHLRHRQAALRTFTPRFLRTLEQLMRDVARERVDVCVRAPHFCGVRELARPIPRRLMCLLLGLPIEDEERLEAWSDAAIALVGGIPSLAELTRGALSVAEFEAYVADRFARATRGGGEGLLSELAARVADGIPSDSEARGLVFQLVVAGNETTVGAIAAALRFAAEMPDGWTCLREQPDDIPAWVEETVRLETPAQGNYRRTLHPVALGGTELPAGATLSLLWGSANRDDAVFPHPDLFELRRPNIKAHLGFGFGSLFCLGAALARMEARVVLEELAQRASGLRLAQPVTELRHVPSVFIRRLVELELSIEA